MEGATQRRPAASDRRITMLSMVLAVVSVMLGFLALRGLTSFSNPDAGPTAPAPVSVHEQATPQKTPPTVRPAAKPVQADRRPSVVAPVAATTPRPAAERTPPREVSNPQATPVRPAVSVEQVPENPRPVSPASSPVVPAVQISHDSVHADTTPVMPAAMQSAARPSIPEPPVFDNADDIRNVPLEEQPPVKLGLFPEAPPRVAPGDLVELSEVDLPPQPTSREMPSYTKRAKKKKQQGTVEMNLLINERGSVSDLRLKQTIPNSDLNEVAINTVRRWRFDPAREDDVPVRVWKPVSIVYSIESGQTRVDLLE